MRVKLASGAKKSVQDFSLTETGMVQVMNDPGERHGVLLPHGSDRRPFAFVRPVTERQDRRWLGCTNELGAPGVTPIEGLAALRRLRDNLGRRLGRRATTELTLDQQGRDKLTLRPASNPRARTIEITYDEDCIYCSADDYTGAWERELDETETIDDICARVQSITDGRVWHRRQLGLRAQYRTEQSAADIPTGRGWQRLPTY